MEEIKVFEINEGNISEAYDYLFEWIYNGKDQFKSIEISSGVDQEDVFNPELVKITKISNYIKLLFKDKLGAPITITITSGDVLKFDYVNEDMIVTTCNTKFIITNINIEI